MFQEGNLPKERVSKLGYLPKFVDILSRLSSTASSLPARASWAPWHARLSSREKWPKNGAREEGRKEEGMSGIEMAKFAFPSVPFFMVIQKAGGSEKGGGRMANGATDGRLTHCKAI